MQVASLKHERNVLRQVGDAVAWSVLRDEPSLIGALWADGRSHHLPEGIGIVAPVQVTRDLNASGDFLAIYNDLTRCLGVGDVTVVSSDGGWRAPLSMELKSRWLDEAKGVCEIDFLSPHSDRPDFKKLFDGVSASLGLKDRRDGTLDSRAQRQVDELLQRTGFLHRMQARLATRLEPPGVNHWKTLEAVVSRVYTLGSAFDVPETGIAFFAVRVHENEGAPQQLQRAIDHLNAEFPLGGKGEAVSSNDLASEPRLSVLVPPILLWPISGDLRNALLAGRLFFGVRMSQHLWSSAFEREGLKFEDSELEWRVSRNGEVGRLDQLEIWKLQLGVALAGVSPAAVAASLREALEAAPPSRNGLALPELRSSAAESSD